MWDRDWYLKTEMGRVTHASMVEGLTSCYFDLGRMVVMHGIECHAFQIIY